MHDFNQKLARLVVQYSLDVQPREQVMIEGSEVANELIKELYIEILKAGAFPSIRSIVKGISESRFKYGNDEQISYIAPIKEVMMRDYDKLINIDADFNRYKLGLIESEKIRILLTSPKLKQINEICDKRMEKGEFSFVNIPFPCDSTAQEAKSDTDSYREFVYNALKLDSTNPESEWKKVDEFQGKMVDKLKKVDQIQVLGEDTNISFSVRGRGWVNSCGHANLPDGEIFTSPIENSVNGIIRFSYPGIYQGKEIENILLEFKNGIVTSCTAEKGQNLLDSILKIKNANMVGEFAIGTNYGITKFTKNMLFDEKMGGTIHMALGMGFPETRSNNLDCAIHWDLLKDMKSESSQIVADGSIIYKAGEWLNE